MSGAPGERRTWNELRGRAPNPRSAGAAEKKEKNEDEMTLKRQGNGFLAKIEGTRRRIKGRFQKARHCLTGRHVWLARRRIFWKIALNVRWFRGNSKNTCTRLRNSKTAKPAT